MSKGYMHGFLESLGLSILGLILSCRISCGAHYQYEACVPTDCGNGLSISFPFYVPDRQESYCGYPGFVLNCSKDGFPVLNLPGNDYIVENISYRNRSLHVWNAAVLRSDGSSCLPSIRNTSLDVAQFDYVNVTGLHLFSNCKKPLPEELLKYKIGCNSSEDGKNWDVALYDKDENLRKALETCDQNVVAPVEGFYMNEGNDGMVNLREVLRRGFALNWIASDCNTCEDSGGRCGFNATTFHFRCFCPDRPHSRSCKPERSRLTLILVTTLSGVGFFLVVCVLVTYIIWQRKKIISRGYLLSRNLSSDPSSKSDIEGGSLYFGIPIFSCAELEEATNNFDSSKELGDGGFGTVYYGKLRDGREVAIKRLYEHNYRRVQQFMNEIKILTSLRHPNLVSLYGCTSRRSRELLLVYEYIPNGTVGDHLHGDRAKEAPLTWPVRMSIAIETASALAYLHKSDIIHRDVKSNNILLDSNFCVKVADFGLSRLFPNDVTHISTAPQGTPGYVDPEYHQCYQLTDKSDVYSFGVVLIELISSMPAVDISRHRHEINLANLAVNRIQRCAFDELIDPSLGYETDAEVMRMTTSVAELAFRCLQLEKDMRPSMDEVLSFLQDIQAGEDGKFEETEMDNHSSTVTRKIPPSPETEDVVLLKNKAFQSSPNTVTDVWASSSSTATSSIG
ncbi:LEAF RUST 10 DISEASE-RESISTANCE LOCUS RECEPTOR-LIKE PROTEIN KINASE-like 1.2 isoform X4 [Sesamum indicum]|uniref:non-specific serine/threonine protein kinase n=1 Tax=Sesamum indicum TaxID=4182 RepID=A0A8M8UQQ0_SESIN|nr:LEAF RUST 10 DISEASE-RESISTANCE LOCUS RECEPTOR-LIKE PROTEIN KINASE-like 1.2 isoform X4 [Sesamum indicum]